jgi:hypothetical protein
MSWESIRYPFNNFESEVLIFLGVLAKHQALVIFPRASALALEERMFDVSSFA